MKKIAVFISALFLMFQSNWQTFGSTTQQVTDSLACRIADFESQIRLADSLYKNYIPQHNFDEVKAAMEFFESTRQQVNKTTSQQEHFGDLNFLHAKSHYYHAVGLTERDDLAGACEHYLRAIEIMEKLMTNDKRQKTKGLKTDDSCPLDADNPQDYEKIKFIALTYNRLGRLFNNECYCELAILKYKKALKYIELIKNDNHKSHILKELGNTYHLYGKADSALYYYNESLRYSDNPINRLDVEKSIALILFYKGEKDSAYILIKNNLHNMGDYGTRDSYHALLGVFYYEDKKYDSAMHYLERCVESTNDHIRNTASVRLSAIYDSLGNFEKKAHYDNITSKLLTETINKEAKNKRIISVYDSYNKRKQEKTNISNRKRNAIVSFAALTFVIIISFVTRYRYKKKNRILSDNIRKNENDYQKELKRLEKNILEKDDEIKSSMVEISKMKHEIERKDSIDLVAYYNSDICKKILEKKDSDFSCLKEDELALLLETADRHLNNISGRLTATLPSLNKNDIYTICLIILNIRKNKLPYLLNRDRKTIWDRLNKIRKLMELDAKQDLFLHIKDNYLR